MTKKVDRAWVQNTLWDFAAVRNASMEGWKETNRKTWKEMKGHAKKCKDMKANGGKSKEMEGNQKNARAWKQQKGHARTWKQMKGNARKWNEMKGNEQKMQGHARKCKDMKAKWKEMKGPERKWCAMLIYVVLLSFLTCYVAMTRCEATLYQVHSDTWATTICRTPALAGVSSHLEPVCAYQAVDRCHQDDMWTSLKFTNMCWYNTQTCIYIYIYICTVYFDLHTCLFTKITWSDIISLHTVTLGTP